MRRAVGALVAAGSLLVAAPSSASVTSVLGGHTSAGGAIPCTTQSDGVRVCHGTYGTPDSRLSTFDGVPLEVYVMLPPAPSSGTDGNYPLVVQSHGWGGSAGGPNDGQFYGPTGDAWAKNGYAVVQLTARGFGMSCGKAAQQAEPPTDFLPGGKCFNGYIRLDDDRYEVRDIQYASGLLVDEGLVDPGRIGATGESYGGGVTMQLATLKDRVMNADGSLSPWKSPGGTPMHLAAGAPVIPWSDLVNSLVPNGRTLDYQVTGPSDDLYPGGVLKQSFVAGLFALGESTGYYAPPGVNSQADLTTWYGSVNAGEPYDSNSEDQQILDQIAHYHSAYYLLDGKYGTAKEPPSPLLISNGFTDDLFPVDEAVRYLNYEHQYYPSNPIGLIDGDFGHMRAQNKAGDKALLSSRIQAFMDHYVKGTTSQPQLGATALAQTCPASAPSGGPFSASSWDALHPGEVVGDAKSAAIDSSSGDPSISAAVDPVASSGACASVSSADQGSGVATLRLPAAKGLGYTLLGPPTVIGTLNVSGSFAYIAARLWDVDPQSGQQTLVARGDYRIDSAKPDGLQIFQLHPGAWHFAAGHIPKLELLGQDSPYLRKSNGTFSISITNLELRLPVHEPPGSSPGVRKPKPHIRPHAHAKACGRPQTRIAKRRTHMTRRRLVIRGSATETRCARASKAKRRKQRVVRVRVTIYKRVHGGRCRFVRRNGKLSGARRCNRPLWLRARGTGRWSLRMKLRVPAGRYFVRVDAVDKLRHHQRRSNASVVRLRVR